MNHPRDEYLDLQEQRLIKAIQESDGDLAAKILGQLKDDGYGRIAERAISVFLTAALTKAIEEQDFTTIIKIFNLRHPEEER
jgi:hypothetical protein